MPAHGTAAVGVITHLDLAADNAAYTAQLTAGWPRRRGPRPYAGRREQGRPAGVKLSVTAKDLKGSGLVAPSC